MVTALIYANILIGVAFVMAEWVGEISSLVKIMPLNTTIPTRVGVTGWFC